MNYLMYLVRRNALRKVATSDNNRGTDDESAKRNGSFDDSAVAHACKCRCISAVCVRLRALGVSFSIINKSENAVA